MCILNRKFLFCSMASCVLSWYQNHGFQWKAQRCHLSETRDIKTDESDCLTILCPKIGYGCSIQQVPTPESTLDGKLRLVFKSESQTEENFPFHISYSRLSRVDNVFIGRTFSFCKHGRKLVMLCQGWSSDGKTRWTTEALLVLFITPVYSIFELCKLMFILSLEKAMLTSV